MYEAPPGMSAVHASGRLGAGQSQPPADYPDAIAMRRPHRDAAKRHRDDLHEWTLYRQVRERVQEVAECVHRM